MTQAQVSAKIDEIMSDLITNCLLHLYMTIESGKGSFFPIKKRNAILSSYLKPKVKDLDYKPVKNEIKNMIFITNKPGGNLEAMLTEISSKQKLYGPAVTGVDRVFNLLNTLDKKYGFDSKLFGEEKLLQEDIIYISREQLDSSFDSDGLHISPMLMFMKTDKISEIKMAMCKVKLFEFEIIEADLGQYHIILNP